MHILSIIFYASQSKTRRGWGFFFSLPFPKFYIFSSMSPSHKKLRKNIHHCKRYLVLLTRTMWQRSGESPENSKDLIYNHSMTFFSDMNLPYHPSVYLSLGRRGPNSGRDPSTRPTWLPLPKPSSRIIRRGEAPESLLGRRLFFARNWRVAVAG